MDNAFEFASLPGLLVAVATGLAQPSDTGLRICAARDLNVVRLIEALGEAETIRGPTLADAFNRVVDARKACLSGNTQEALAIYDRVTTELTQIGGRSIGSGR